MTMIRKESAGDYQIGIWSVRRDGRKWLAQATGPGTVGDGDPHSYPTLSAAYLALTGEPLRLNAPRAMLYSAAAGADLRPEFPARPEAVAGARSDL